MNIYWVQTADHDEDWFIVAPDQLEACAFHELEEGYADGDAWAEFVVQIPDHLESEVGWPSHELLVACGAEFIREETPRVVRIGERTFCEGMLEHQILQMNDDIFEALGEVRVNRTERRREN